MRTYSYRFAKGTGEILSKATPILGLGIPAAQHPNEGVAAIVVRFVVGDDFMDYLEGKNQPAPSDLSNFVPTPMMY